jgi:hypothetical protein
MGWPTGGERSIMDALFWFIAGTMFGASIGCIVAALCVAMKIGDISIGQSDQN